MKIFFLTDQKNNRAVVIAAHHDDALSMRPYNFTPNAHVEAKYLGEATPTAGRGVVLKSA